MKQEKMKPDNMLHGLYAITSDSSQHELIAAVHKVIKGGASLIQFRPKSPTAVYAKEQTARALLELCRAHQIPLIINDDAILAKTIGADGVHLGEKDISIAQARTLLGEQAIIGVSCYNRLALALKAEKEGADYVAFGSFFPSGTKPDAPKAKPALLNQAKAQLTLPIVAIGGITPDNGAALIKEGADALAVIQGLFEQTDPYTAARQYAPCFRNL